MTRRLCLSFALAAAMVLLLVVPVFAYYFYITVTESLGTDYTNLALNFTLDIDYLVDNDYITITGLDTRITDSTYTVLPHMLADDKVLWVGDIEGDATTQFAFFTGQDAIDSFPTITGHGGYVTVPDNAVLEPGDMYAFGIIGYVDTADGSNKNIIRKASALLFSVTDDAELTFAITGGNSLVATGVSSGYMTIMIYSDGYELWMTIDDVEQDRVVASVVPDTANDWVLFENDVMPYVYYFGIWIV